MNEKNLEQLRYIVSEAEARGMAATDALADKYVATCWLIGWVVTLTIAGLLTFYGIREFWRSERMKR